MRAITTEKGSCYGSAEFWPRGINDCLDRTATDYRDELDTLLSHNFQTFDNVSILAG